MTEDGSLSAHFEHTIAIQAKGSARILVCAVIVVSEADKYVPKEDVIEVQERLQKRYRTRCFEWSWTMATKSWRISPGKCGCISSVSFPGDKVTVELSPYDLTRGRITYRFK